MNTFTNAKVIQTAADAALYHAQTAERGTLGFQVSQGMLREFDRCPLRWVRGYTPPDGKAKAWGSMLDCLLLTPEEFEWRYPLRPDTYPAPATHEKVKKGLITAGDPLPWNANAAICKEWEATMEGRSTIKSATLFDLQQSVKRLRADAAIEDVLGASANQVWVRADYHDAATGLVIPCKGLIDGVPFPGTPVLEHCLWDLKSTRSALPEAWVKWVYQTGLHVQAAWYLDMYNAATGEERSTWLWILQENFPPWEVGRRMASQAFIELGRLFYRSALARYAKCLSTGVWPGYDSIPGQRQSLGGWTDVVPLQWMLDRGLDHMGAATEEAAEEDDSDPEMPEGEVTP